MINLYSMKFQELKDRWKSPVNTFWYKIQIYCVGTLLSLGSIYASIAGLQTTGLYIAPNWLLKILEITGTFCIGILAAAKFTKTDTKPEEVNTDEKKVEAIKEIISVDNKE